MPQTSPQPRTIAIGDIHGCAIALEKLIATVKPTQDDIIVTLGDHIDWGPDSQASVSRSSTDAAD